MEMENEYIQYNSLNTEQLFKIYNLLHFTYPDKMEHLNPVIDIIQENWRKALKLNFPLFWVSTIKQNKNNIISSGTVWQYLNKGMIAQHLCSNHPVGSRMIFLGMLNKAKEKSNTGFIDSFQVYYRPQNKYSSKLFESQSLSAGKEFSEIIPFNYHELPLLKSDCAGDIQLTEINDNKDSDYINFLIRQRGELFVNSQELNAEDIKLEKLNARFQCHGLHRTRRIFTARIPSSNRVYGVIVINQSSIGLNFSFFENCCELILCKDSNPELLLPIAHKLLFKASEINASSPIEYIPVMTEPIHSGLVEKLKGKLTRNYNLFIMLKGGYQKCYEQVDLLTNSIFARFNRNSLKNSNSEYSKYTGMIIANSTDILGANQKHL